MSEQSLSEEQIRAILVALATVRRSSKQHKAMLADLIKTLGRCSTVKVVTP